jgi:methyltransferase (TIGR00027 family)
MEEGRPSRTALVAAPRRAIHLLQDDPPKIFEDTFALGLCGFESETALRAAHDATVAKMGQSLGFEFARVYALAARAHGAVKSRYAEDELEQAVEQGIIQYVFIGAGLDSFAYRRRDLMPKLRVFEVDHPASQAWKRARLRDLGIEVPANVAFVPVDFEKQSFVDRLQTNGYDAQKPGFFAWLSVVPYLSTGTILATLRSIASLPAGTQIVFDYLVPDTSLDDDSRRIHATFTDFAAASGEPLQSLFEPAALLNRLKEVGFSAVRDATPDHLNARYCPDRTDDFRLWGMFHFIRAKV